MSLKKSKSNVQKTYLLNECSFRGTELIDRLFIYKATVATDEDKINLVWKKTLKIAKTRGTNNRIESTIVLIEELKFP